MKIRTGFVSNSSSSSFLIAFKKEDNKCPTCGRSDENSIDLLKRILEDHYESELDREGYNEIIKYFEEDCYYNEEDLNERKIKMKELKDKGYEFMLMSISYHDELSRNIIKNSKNIEIIYRGDDY